ncbi:TerD family protein [Deinococcus peraridilitoris]|uniref:Putative stress response protein, TerZ-and CABP1 n=1 Tax=Deinococcus peraridilitoris (strain DSM 19664 / LMG 22246 / CIP 109416 / KR-200) TaxID=937777 RepID=L0A377_DEIPD|nr:TerD family protein [Deinococcus peraridilitoris]AFZ67465.1 putative stress response protein, TerZ- and CABP1 [Deinococcus peraridilitoris DSM 19664]
MTISLQKKQTISLEKSGQSLAKIFMGLGWDVAKPKGFLGALLGGGGASIDLDASALLFDAAGSLVDTVWFRSLQSRDGSVRHAGDNLTGEGEGDDERIFVDLTRLSGNVQSIVFTVNSFRGQTFDKVAGAFCRIVNEQGGQEIAKFNLSEQGGHTGLVMVKLVRQGGTWQLTAVGERFTFQPGSDVVGQLTAAAARAL